MKKFAINIILFSTICLASLYLIQYVIDKENRKMQSVWFAEWNDCYNGNVDADLLVMGSSRAWRHFSTKILDTTLNLRSYNLGLDGWGFLIQNCRLKVCLAHNRMPKTIVHSVDMLTLWKRDDLFASKQFVPYLGDTLIRRYTEGYQGSFNKLHYYFPLYKYNNSIYNIFAPLASVMGIKKSVSPHYKGYQGNDAKWDNSLDEFKKKNARGKEQKIDSQTLREFEEYIQFCKAKGINLIFVYAPEYVEGQMMTRNRADIIAHYENFSKKYDIPFLNYSNDSLSYDKSLFYNSQHLNKKGSELFSLKLAKQLKGMIKS